MSLESITKKTGKFLWVTGKWVLTIIGVYFLLRTAGRFNLFWVIGSLILVLLARWGIRVADCAIGLEKIFYEKPGAWIRETFLNKSSRKAKIISNKFSTQRSNWNPLTWIIWIVSNGAKGIEKSAEFVKPVIVETWNALTNLLVKIIFVIRGTPVIGGIMALISFAMIIVLAVFIASTHPLLFCLLLILLILFIFKGEEGFAKVVDFMLKCFIISLLIKPIEIVFAKHSLIVAIAVLFFGWFLKDWVLFLIYTQYGFRRHNGNFMTKIKHTINDWKMLHKDADLLEETYSKEFMKKIKSKKSTMKDLDEHMSKYIMELVAAKKVGVNVDRSALDALRNELKQSMAAEDIDDLFKIIEAMKYD